jgi:hypothetical protein
VVAPILRIEILFDLSENSAEFPVLQNVDSAVLADPCIIVERSGAERASGFDSGFVPNGRDDPKTTSAVGCVGCNPCLCNLLSHLI